MMFAGYGTLWNHVTAPTFVVWWHLMLCVGVCFRTLCLVLRTSYLQAETRSRVEWCSLPCTGTDPVTLALVLSPQHSHFYAEELPEMQQCGTVEKKGRIWTSTASENCKRGPNMLQTLRQRHAKHCNVHLPEGSLQIAQFSICMIAWLYIYDLGNIR